MLLPLMSAAAIFTVSRQISQLPVWKGQTANEDWLIAKPTAKAELFRTVDPKEIVLSNGLVARTFRISPNAATVGLEELTKGNELVRAASPEALVTIDGIDYEVGGLTGQPDLAYLTQEWKARLRADPKAFQFAGLEVGVPAERLKWKATRPHEDDPWPPKGVRLTLNFTAPKDSAVEGVKVAVSYELYDGLPILGKSFRLENDSGKQIRLNRFSLEKLRMVEAESEVNDESNWAYPNVTILTDYAFGGFAPNDLNRTTYWEADPDYDTQVNYDLKTPCVLRIAPPLGPAADVVPGKAFDSFHAYMIVHDDWDRERKGLAVRKAYRALAPWTTESPIMLHLTSTEPKTVKTAIDQAADVGFEMVILSFGSGLDMEDESSANITKYKKFAEYAHSKGLQLGGYNLLASRRIDDADDVIDPKTGKTGHAVFGNSPCLGSAWGMTYFRKIKKFLSETGFDLLEHDGSYPGDVCASTMHPGHRGLEDSQWNQFQIIAEFYRWCRERGIYLNVPDCYMLSGSNKDGMGYRETNWSLPRAQQQIHARQNLYDGTWLKPPTMGWMFVPLVEYHGGGPAATIEPLKDHLADYKMHLVNNFGYGAQACYRGPRLYDSPETEALVKREVAWFKRHRKILESDVIHIRRPDGEHIDAILHVNPRLAERGLLVVWNPAGKAFVGELKVPLYYAGLNTAALVSHGDGPEVHYRLARDYSIPLRVVVPAQGYAWYVIRAGS